ncbi:hypothetical protein PENDEC_c014G05382 [Penicillium decumbens]|uniref:Hydrophobin n=1 Tax=Penicillium decumbens TaxID=69771 RepID=A0A1V6P9P4_PENDC|nr:hypothetical protein PENDEC_c014G05382 [Penicillium decumbens]
MKFIFATLALAATAFAASSCKGGQTAVCKGNGNGGLLTLGNVAPGALGEACSGGDVYCCDDKAIGDVGLVNLDVNAQCSLNHLL